MTETFKKFKPLDDEFLLVEHMASSDFADTKLAAPDHASLIYKMLHAHGAPEKQREEPHGFLNFLRITHIMPASLSGWRLGEF